MVDASIQMVCNSIFCNSPVRIKNDRSIRGIERSQLINLGTIVLGCPSVLSIPGCRKDRPLQGQVDTMNLFGFKTIVLALGASIVHNLIGLDSPLRIERLVTRRALRNLCRLVRISSIIEPALKLVTFLDRSLQNDRRRFYRVGGRVIRIIRSATQVIKNLIYNRSPFCIQSHIFRHFALEVISILASCFLVPTSKDIAFGSRRGGSIHSIAFRNNHCGRSLAVTIHVKGHGKLGIKSPARIEGRITSRHPEGFNLATILRSGPTIEIILLRAHRKHRRQVTQVYSVCRNGFAFNNLFRDLLGIFTRVMVKSHRVDNLVTPYGIYRLRPIDIT